MASTSYSPHLHLLFVFAFLARLALAADLPAIPPSLPPLPPADSVSHSPTPASSPAPAPAISSPPAPPPSDLAPNSDAPASKQSPSPTPAPALVGDSRREDDPNAADLEANKKESSGGMNSGKKAGVAIGVVAGACVVGAGVFVFKKRQQNIRRSQYGGGGIQIL